VGGEGEGWHEAWQHTFERLMVRFLPPLQLTSISEGIENDTFKRGDHTTLFEETMVFLYFNGTDRLD
jgi:hypothetical protein